MLISEPWDEILFFRSSETKPSYGSSFQKKKDGAESAINSQHSFKMLSSSFFPSKKKTSSLLSHQTKHQLQVSTSYLNKFLPYYFKALPVDNLPQIRAILKAGAFVRNLSNDPISMGATIEDDDPEGIGSPAPTFLSLVLHLSSSFLGYREKPLKGSFSLFLQKLKNVAGANLLFSYNSQQKSNKSNSDNFPFFLRESHVCKVLSISELQ